MDQKCSGEVGQIAGRDVKDSNSQANVNNHLHNGAKAKRYISDRQRRAVTIAVAATVAVAAALYVKRSGRVSQYSA
ncbi:hypothetical protein [Burkholderia ubonensis]|uniref:hypothetical protein n=1 Tax=Burkholderia ubonensis TaxID=101571 RepID=UPI001E6036C0|nr:hypothetical protein [Burkholderia ubonensis]